MPPPWMKLWPEKLLTPDFFMLSERARTTLVYALVLAHRMAERPEPMRVADLQVFTGIPMPKQIVALRELDSRGFVTLRGDDVERVDLYEAMQRPKSNAERQKDWRKRNASPNAESNVSRNAKRNEDVTKKNRSIDTPQSANADLPPEGPRRIRPQADGVEFDEPDEARVGSVVTITANENKTGTIAVSRIATIRGDLRRLLDEHGAEAWRYGLDEAIRRGKGAAYAAAIVKAAAKRLAAGNTLTVPAPTNGKRVDPNAFGYSRGKG